VDDLDGEPYYVESPDPWQSSSVGFRGRCRLVAGIPTLGNGQWARWTPDLPAAGFYAVYFYLPPIMNGRNRALYVVKSSIATPDSQHINQNINSGNWIMLGVYFFNQGMDGYVEVVNDDSSTAGWAFFADAVRFITCPSEKDIEPVRRNAYNFGDSNIGEAKPWVLRIYNIGGTTLTIYEIRADTPVFQAVSPSFPAYVEPHQYVDVRIHFIPTFERIFTDTLRIFSDDIDEPEVKIPVSGRGTTTTVIVNNDDGPEYYREHVGSWYFSSDAATFEGINNPTSRYSWLSEVGSRAEFIPTIPKPDLYTVYMAVPPTMNASDHALYEVHPFGSRVDSVYLNQNNNYQNVWKPIGTYYFPQGRENSVYVVNDGTGRGAVLRADMIKFVSVSSIADIELAGTLYDFGEVSVDSFGVRSVKVYNLGSQDLTLTGATTRTPYFDVISPAIFPITVNALDSINVVVRFSPEEIRDYADTLTITSNDIDEPEVYAYLRGTGIGLTVIVDNSDPAPIFTMGPTDTTWHPSTSQYGVNKNSLYSFIRANPGAWVQWVPNIPQSGEYDVYASQIPGSSNSTKNAPYIIQPFGVPPETVLVSQYRRGTDELWAYLGRFYFVQGTLSWIKLVNDTTITLMDMEGVNEPSVIRADAIKVTEPGVTGVKERPFASLLRSFHLYPNYPNPFNPETTIRFDIPIKSQVSLRIYNVLGQEVRTLVNEKKRPGTYSVTWNGRDKFRRAVSSGVYFVLLEAKPDRNIRVVRVNKMLLIR